MPRKEILMFGHQVVLACDGRCDKAWGINGRPKTQLSANEDDYVFKGDDELEEAPGPGKTVILFEGEHVKPSATPLGDTKGHLMNKWCARECERSDQFAPGETIIIPDLKNPEPNIPRSAIPPA